MSQFTLDWDNTALLATGNTIGQRAVYRYKSVGGAFISTGFTPDNDLADSVDSVDSPVLDDNKVIEFKIQTLCEVSGPTDNDNGIQEVIDFAEIIPEIGKDDSSSEIEINVTNLDITKARFTLRKASDNSLVTSTVVNKSVNTIALTKTGLTFLTNYYWQIELYAIVNTIEVISSYLEYIGTPFSPYPFTTDAPPVCDPVTAMDVTSVEIP